MERTKAPFVKPDITSGPGIPKYFWPLFEQLEEEKAEIKKEESDFTAFSAKLNLEEYDFKDDLVDPHKTGLTLDVTALDLYNDDVKKYRKLIIQECRQIRTKAKLDESSLEGLSRAVVRLCRCAYYGTVRSQTLAEGALPLIIWLLNRKHFPEAFTVTVLRSLSEMCWNSLRIKSKLVESFGLKVLFRTMKNFPTNRRLASWATYTLCIAATGSSEVILATREIPGMQELVGELSFGSYWYDWPANFGSILEAILYGPRAVSVAEEFFQFL